MKNFKIEQNKGLYGGVALLSLLLVFVATGGGLSGSEGYWLTDWQHQTFRTLCHQDPARSFWINGKPMAVCSRCYGIYTGFFVFWLSIPLFSFISRKIESYEKKILLAAVMLNVVDVVGNILGFWQNTPVSRFFMGNIIGITVVTLLAGDFINTKSKLTRDAYGYDGTG